VRRACCTMARAPNVSATGVRGTPVVVYKGKKIRVLRGCWPRELSGASPPQKSARRVRVLVAMPFFRQRAAERPRSACLQPQTTEIRAIGAVCVRVHAQI